MVTLRNHPLLQTDSYGKIFLYTTQEDVACVPRHRIRMSEPVRPTCLLNAIKTALLRFPHMMLGLAADTTQYKYRLLVEEPVVLPFDGVTQRYTIGSEDTHGYMFLAGYHNDTIFMEYQHSISDGRGFEEFIRCVLFHYLLECGHAVENDGTIRTTETAYVTEESEDAFRKLDEMEPSPAGIYQKPAALHADGLTWENDSPEVVTEITFPFSALHAKAKEYGVSPLSMIAPMFSRAFYQKFGEGHTEPVISEIPVDLRQFIPSLTTRYFVCFIDLPYEAEYNDLPLPEVFRKTKDFLNSQMQTEQLLYRAKRASSVCRELHERNAPLAEKEAEGRQIARQFVRDDTFLITNVGQFKLPESMRQYVKEYGAVLPCSVQPFAMLISSYNGTMKLSVAQRDHDFQVVTSLQQMLSSLGIPTEMSSYPFLVTRYDGALSSIPYVL
ncbi:MAG: hypothetical protein HFH26_06645 [Clostridiaceae bacterium]|nr:hypothetical protein [Clostridiaceae bacterium]